MGQYILQKTLVKHGDSVNALAFSYDGSLFASGADDDLVIVFRGNGSGQELRRFQVKAPVTTLHWHSRFGYTIIAGDASGDVHTICLNDSANVSASHFHAYGYIRDSVHRETCIIIPLTTSLGPSTASCNVLHCWPLVRGKLCS